MPSEGSQRKAIPLRSSAVGTHRRRTQSHTTAQINRTNQAQKAPASTPSQNQPSRPSLAQRQTTMPSLSVSPTEMDPDPVREWIPCAMDRV